MPALPSPLRVAVLVDLPLTPTSGGHARGWEKVARAAAEQSALPLDLTVFFSGDEKTTEILSPLVRLRRIPPIFSTKKLAFLPYVPDHTDLAPYHPVLARELGEFDVLHTTDAFFAFARTAEKSAHKNGVALTTSFHTDTPAYARVFAQRTIETFLGKSAASRFLCKTLRFPERQEKTMDARLRTHVRACRSVLATRQKDMDLAKSLLGKDNVFFMRTPADRTVFGPHRKDRTGIEKEFGLPPGRVLCLFVGRLDEGKNIYTLLEAMQAALAQGAPLHLLAAGIGPAEKDLKARLGTNVTLAGFVQPHDLGRLYASADLMVMPSEVEMRSLVAVEAVLSGLPVLLSEKGGVARHYDNPKAMLPLNSPKDWAEALIALSKDAEKRAELSRSALAFAAKNVPDWRDFLAQDFLPVWQRAAAMNKRTS